MDKQDVRKKQGIKNQIATLRKQLEKDELTIPSLKALELRKSKIENYITEYTQVQSQFISLCADNELEEQLSEKTEIESLCEDILIRYLDLVVKATVVNPVVPQPIVDLTPSVKARLPTLGLPDFDGNYFNWLPFHDRFVAMVHCRTDLLNVVKLQYLMSCLHGEAERLLHSIQMTDSNYDKAWNILVEKYHSSRKLREFHIKMMMSQQAVSMELPKAVLDFVETTKSCMSALETLKCPVSQWNEILMHFFIEKIDQTTRQKWALHTAKDDNVKVDDFLEFLYVRAEAMQSVEQLVEKKPTATKTSQSTRFAHNVVSADSPKVCRVCKDGNHLYIKCPKLLSVPALERRYLISRTGSCFNCFGQGHISRTCTQASKCSCGSKHHSLLHTDSVPIHSPAVDSSTYRTVENSTIAETESAKKQSITAMAVSNYYQTLLLTAQAKVKDANGQYQRCRVLLDNGSQVNLISQECATRLGLHLAPSKVQISGVGSGVVSSSLGSVNIQLMSLNSEFCTSFMAHILPTVTSQLPSYTCNTKKWTHLKNLQLADPDFYTPAPIDILLRVTQTGLILQDGRRIGLPGTPMAQCSSLGWVLSGDVSMVCGNAITAKSTHDLIERFWALENVNTQENGSVEQQDCFAHFATHHSRDPTGRYTVCLPFRNDSPSLGDSKGAAYRRLMQLEKKLKLHPDRQLQYTQFMEEYLHLGHMEVIPAAAINSPVSQHYYLPHHYVLKDESSTTKLRVVFDASAKSNSKVSLYDKLMVGPTIQDDIVSILIRFRTYAIALTADIAKMYRQFRINPPDADYQRILWRSSPNIPVQEYRLLTVTYGTASAPFLATQCLQQLAKDEAIKYPVAAEVTCRDFYVDYVLTGAATQAEALVLQKQLIQLMNQGGMQLRKWTSNDPCLIDAVPPEMRGTTTEQKMNLMESTKTLGLRWNPSLDEFFFVVTPLSNQLITKRVVLAEIAKIFDPLGWVSPVTIKAKMFMQKLWSEKVDWDERLPSHFADEWVCQQSALTQLTGFKLKRCITTESSTYELHAFCDASIKAYAAVVYLRTTSNRASDSDYSLPTSSFDPTIRVELIAAKTRVAPLKTQSLPRLELCAAHLCSSLLSIVLSSINLPIKSTHAWSDSTITLAWIASPAGRWKQFVSNRVSYIQGVVPASNWHHVSGKENPADCASRGIKPSELLIHPLWWNGPQWLQSPYFEPTNQQAFTIDDEELLSEFKLPAAVNQVIAFDLHLLQRYSSLTRLSRITAYCVRFARNAKLPSHQRHTGWLSVLEMRTAINTWVKLVQHIEFAAEIHHLSNGHQIPVKSKLLNLSPFLDHNGLLRVGGRLRRSSLPNEQKHPLLLPRSSVLTEMIVSNEHLRLHHAGPQLLLSALHQHYWIICGRDVVRFHVRKCVICFRNKATAAQQFMSDLPASRVTPSRPFSVCGVDFAGPYIIKDRKGRGSKTSKAYMALFVCFSTRAIHLELASDLSSDTFIGALKRFIGSRGKPAIMHSDCGSNFVGASPEVTLMSSKTQETLQRSLADQGIEWRFNPPSAPHFGGLWEAGIKSTKYHLKRILGLAVLTFEEMTTALKQVEACLNSRPLCPLSTDPDDLQPLTPGHFLIGAPLNALPEENLSDVRSNRLSRWQLVQKLYQDFWHRWSSEYLSRLQQRPKWLGETPSLKIGDLVLIKEDNIPPLKWKLGRVIAVHPGKDKKVRVVTMKTADGEVKRPIVKLCVLPLEKNHLSTLEFQPQR